MIAACFVGNGARAANRAPFGGSIREVPAVQPGIAATGAVLVRSSLTAAELAAPVNFEIALRMRNFAGFQSRVARNEQIGAAEVADQYAPLEADYQKVVDWIQDQGLVVTRTDANHLAVFGRGSIAAVQEAFHTQFARVAAHGAEFTSAVTAPSLPEEIAAQVLGIHGLQPHIRLRPLLKLGRTRGAGNAATSAEYYPPQIATAYNATGLGTGITGAGQAIAFYELAYPSTTDLSYFWKSSNVNVSQSLANYTQVDINGGPGDWTSSDEMVEAALDVEWAGALAPGANLRVYGCDASDTTGADQASVQILADATANPGLGLHQYSISFGYNESEIEPDYLLVEAQYMASLANAGITVFAATGDGGSNPDPSTGEYNPAYPVDVFYPASDPCVTAVGGTTLILNSSGTISSETAWSCSGGGYSRCFPGQSWQSSLGSGSMRMIPDVAGPADPQCGAAVYVSSGQGWQSIGGTSWSTPVWAGFCALINQARTRSSAGPLGFLNPRIYPRQGTSSFHDITYGDNGMYSANVGYDLVTGLGDTERRRHRTGLSRWQQGTGCHRTDQRSLTTFDQSATFAVVAAGAANLTYQWQREPAGTTSWVNLTDGSDYQGSLTSDLVVKGFTIGMTGDSFQCVVSNSAGTATSAPAMLTVNLTGVSTLAGWPEASGWADGTGSAARFVSTNSVRLDNAGNLYVGDGANTVRKVTPDGVVTTIAGSPERRAIRMDRRPLRRSTASAALAIDNSTGNLYVADCRNYTIREITSNGVVSTLAGSAGVSAESMARVRPRGLPIPRTWPLTLRVTSGWTGWESEHDPRGDSRWRGHHVCGTGGTSGFL